MNEKKLDDLFDKLDHNEQGRQARMYYYGFLDVSMVIQRPIRNHYYSVRHLHSSVRRLHTFDKIAR